MAVVSVERALCGNSAEPLFVVVSWILAGLQPNLLFLGRIDEEVVVVSVLFFWSGRRVRERPQKRCV